MFSALTIEDCLGVDLRQLRPEGLADGCSGTLRWFDGRRLLASSSYRCLGSTLILGYSVAERGGQPRPMRERISFAFTEQKLGGVRRWFCCPGCKRRCLTLYCLMGHFRCRKCHRLGYASQRQAWTFRVLVQAQKFRQRFGASGSMDEPFPDRPKGMHAHTYERIARKGERLDARVVEAGRHLNRRLASIGDDFLSGEFGE